jgi:glycosyltransferase involved in cell wall biosynthesis
MLTDSNLQWTKRANTDNCFFSILVPTWNNLPYLKLCIESIRKNSTSPHQIIVHINEGTDGTLEWVKEQADLDFVHSKNNIGICYALNACRRLATTQYILYINDDMYVCPEWDKYLKEEIEKVGHHYFFISATAIEPKTTNPCAIESDFGRDIETFKEKELLQKFEALPMDDWQGATWPPNVVHISVWDLVGGYSIEYSPGLYSDPDFSMKLWKIGVRYYKGVAKSRVYHFGSKSLNRIKRNSGYYTFLNKWNITTSTLTKHFLKQGTKFSGPVVETELPVSLKLKNRFKKILSGF